MCAKLSLEWIPAAESAHLTEKSAHSLHLSQEIIRPGLWYVTTETTNSVLVLPRGGGLGFKFYAFRLTLDMPRQRRERGHLSEYNNITLRKSMNNLQLKMLLSQDVMAPEVRLNLQYSNHEFAMPLDLLTDARLSTPSPAPRPARHSFSSRIPAGAMLAIFDGVKTITATRIWTRVTRCAGKWASVWGQIEGWRT